MAKKKRGVVASFVEKVVINCGACRKLMEPSWVDIQYEAGCCPACTKGPEFQYTCLCGGNRTYLEFQCSGCKYVGEIEYL